MSVVRGWHAGTELLMEMSSTFATLARLQLQTLALSLGFVAAGHFFYRALFGRPAADRISLTVARSYFLGLLTLDVVAENADVVVARRPFRQADLQLDATGRHWAWLDFELPRDVKEAQLRLWTNTDAAFKVTRLRLRQP